MMVEVKRLVCDNCGKIVDGEGMPVRLPKGWCVLGYHKQSFAAYDDWRITHHFCSSECLDAVKVVTPK